MMKHLLALSIVLAAHAIVVAEDTKGHTEYTIVIDEVTRYIFKAKPDIQVPAVNPRTGKATITRAVYCEQCPGCDRWKSVVLTEGKTHFCPVHKTEMTLDGKIPDNLQYLENVKPRKK
ncbi:hypothetical protein SH661x_001906 [Planctomicrobium sp. SH661]|uniref:hypothetical protein n=1 Tax=Planctomicrobium sp. SH661 TaxID=3448124 RepID=UPI003F5B81BD